MAFKTEFEFTLPKGFVDEHGNLHRKGVMRLATAKDEIIPLQDFRVKNNRAYLVIILLSRVITKLGDLKEGEVNPASSRGSSPRTSPTCRSSTGRSTRAARRTSPPSVRAAARTSRSTSGRGPRHWGNRKLPVGQALRRGSLHRVPLSVGHGRYPLDAAQGAPHVDQGDLRDQQAHQRGVQGPGRRRRDLVLNGG